ncbi:PREDICTED: cytochrome P450 3A8-like [Branchiostoma belcheri]|uniref:Cytochrome P450 3A8-like n=1 Tax=Branchiostoma belcheri TaxID=7741 RepID=A0A6P4Z2M0_BRABE|nr:PREDICTED: cytochrome P450 3A8-like [Branchiostoma belcheri]XP_019625333.1 PREDICTED: cytochrome P450 3A8-like [Branchiostoma belcheri]XP_019625335.1 PREDICTED: cytochrome P450 3A8-like [Branchiostoma belcheri]
MALQDFLPSDVPMTWILLALLAVLFYLYAVHPLWTFKRMGIPGPTPLPFFGNLLSWFKDGIWNIEVNRQRVEKYGKVYGFFFGRMPILIVSDREMLREIFVKKFHALTNRTGKEMLLDTRPSGRMLTNLRDEDWKEVRSTLRPAFSGGKLKMMGPAINTCADQLVQNIAKFAETGESFDTRELTGAFTMDVIARTAFGTEIDSQRNPQDPFVLMGKKAFNVSIKNPLVLLYFVFPSVMKPILEWLNMDLFPSDATRFFYGIFDQLIALRQKSNEKGRVDFMQLMMDAHKDTEEEAEEGVKSHGQKRALTRDDVVANGFLFFVAGYETTASTMAFVLYNFALNQEEQKKARKEIKKIMEDRDLVDYEAVHEMSYLEMCCMETLRMYPPVADIGRIVDEEVKIQWLTIPKDMFVMVQVLAIHYDPERWPEPMKFIPERFTKEAREKRDPYDWLPFGAGPRTCIGMRLAMMELKVGVAKILMEYHITTAPDTDIPLKMKKGNQFPTPENGVRLKVELLNQDEN